ncbi:MAG: DUF3095 family protein [Opitutaceae bacterium]|nr:DUF3095 family protein [Verrucomicrobiales bacterium]
MDSTRFYSDLPTNTIPVSKLMGDETRFFDVPEDWQVIVTDVRRSTHALGDGKHQVVNLVAAGSIIAALNIAHRVGVSVPFFFGGDGATLLAPPSLAGRILRALTMHRENARASFDLDLRVGSVPLADVYRQKLRLKIAKVDINQGLVIPVALGEGLQYVEKLIKSDDYLGPETRTEGTLDLKGMECRWDNIRPPENTQEVVCLMLTACDSRRQAAIFSAVLDQIDAIYGPLSVRNPVSLPQLKLEATVGKIKTEMRARLGRFNLGYLIVNWFCTRVGALYFAFTKEGAEYLNHVVQWSDTLVIDGRISTIMSGTVGQRNRLVESLRCLEEHGEIRFGLQVCTASVMSCYVRNRRDQHIHFVDGLGGGYTQAATMLKRKLMQPAVS